MLKVTPVAFTTFLDGAAQDASGYQPHTPGGQSYSDELAEFAGRACYQSWNRPNPATATNEGYLDNILNQGHESVLEHASITFYVTGVSRSLLAELSRHRHLSFSVLSQRYVNMEDAKIVVPPGVVNAAHEEWVKDHPEATIETTRDEITEYFEKEFLDGLREQYAELVGALEGIGWKRKQAREAARSILPNCIESPMVVTGNIRAWRDVLKKRYHVAADVEIRDFATEVLKHLREYAPNSVQDFPGKPFGSDHA